MVIDSLEVDIQGKSDSVNKSLDDLVRKLDLVVQGISAIGKNNGLNNFAKEAAEATKGLANIQNMTKNMAKGISASITPEMQKISKSVNELTENFREIYKDLGKGIKFEGTTEQLRKEIQKVFNAWEKAKVDLQQVSLAENIDASKLEKAVAKTVRLQNEYESLSRILNEATETQKQWLAEAEEGQNKVSENAKVVSDKVEQVQEVLSNIQPVQIDFDTSKLDESRQSLNGFSKEVQNMFDLIKQRASLPALRNVETWYQLSESIKDYVKNSQIAAGIKVYTEDYKNILNDIERTKGALEKLEQKQHDLQDAGISEESERWKKVTTEIATAEKQLEIYIDKMQEMEVRGTDVEFSGGLANQSWIKTTGVVAKEAISSLRQKIGEIGGAVSQAVGNIPVIGRAAKESAFIAQSAFNGLKAAMSGIASVSSKVVNAVSTITAGIKRLVSGIKNVISKFSSMAKSFIGVKGASNGMNASFAVSLKTMLKYAFSIRSLFALFNKLRNVTKEAFGNLAQYSPEVNKSLSMMKSSLDALKNSLAAAFAPILNVIAPYLSMFIDMLTKALNTVGQFFAALTGKSFAAQAKKNFSDYAAGVSKAGAAAKKAGKDAKGALRPFDELKTISLNNEEDSGGGGDTGISPADMFTTVPIESSVSDFAQKVKDAWAKADFTEIGQILGMKLKNALDSIQWEPIQETAAKIGTSIGTLINGFVEVEGLSNTIGQTIGEAINTGIDGVNAFLDSTHWDSVGIFIGERLNGIVNTVDWSGVGHLFAQKFNAIFEVLGNIATTFDWSNFGLQLATSINTFITDFDWAENGARLGELAKGLLDTLITLLEETNWQELGNGIADFIGGIDWQGLTEKLAEGIGAALGGLAALLQGLIGDAWNEAINWWNDVAYEDGEFTIEGLLNGIGDALLNIYSWIKEHIFQPFIDGFKKAFGIASPSKVMEEQGNFIMLGLFNGISSLTEKVISVFTKIKDKMLDIWDKAKTGTSKIWEQIKNSVKSPINAIIGFINRMITGVVSGINSVANALNSLSFEIPSWVPKFGGSNFGFNIPNITAPQIPYLANGAVLKGGNPFLAVVNDQKRGQTNVETPLKVIQEALREELKRFSTNYEIAPAPSPEKAYRNYQYDTSAYITSRNEDSELQNTIEKAVYKATYNAVSSAIGNSGTLGDIKDLVEDIYNKPTMEIGELGSQLAKNSWINGGTTGSSGMRLAVAEELYN